MPEINTEGAVDLTWDEAEVLAGHAFDPEPDLGYHPGEDE